MLALQKGERHCQSDNRAGKDIPSVAGGFIPQAADVSCDRASISYLRELPFIAAGFANIFNAFRTV